MNEHDRKPMFKPTHSPYLAPVSRETELKRPYIACWINSHDVPVPIGRFHMRKSAVCRCRSAMLDDSTGGVNHHTRFYVYDSSLPWDTSNLNSWCPIAERLRDQWIPSR